MEILTGNRLKYKMDNFILIVWDNPLEGKKYISGSRGGSLEPPFLTALLNIL